MLDSIFGLILYIGYFIITALLIEYGFSVILVPMVILGLIYNVVMWFKNSDNEDDKKDEEE